MALTSAMALMSVGRSGGDSDASISIWTSEISGCLARSKFFSRIGGGAWKRISFASSSVTCCS